jgi:2-methylaconitate cis-trans-isomerase PrpF/ubiquinone/menaquinone biosynthesis C-methylase UbiE
MPLRAIRAVFMRGGTSKAILFRAEDLPADRADWHGIFLAAIGSPDPSGRQLDGMGGGVSSLSKVCIIGKPTRPDADIDYTFAQIGIREPVVDTASNCGNMSAAIGPFAVDEGLVATPREGEASVRIHNTNTGKIIVARFPVSHGRFVTSGDLAIDGVAGTAAPIKLDFTNPGGAKTGKLLPTGNAADTLDVPGYPAIRARLVDAGNPCVLIAASDVGMQGTELPEAMEANPDLLRHLEAIRCAGSVAMGMAATLADAGRIASVPKLVCLTKPADSVLLSGETLAAESADITARVISTGQPHRAIPVTAALCLAIAARIPGSIAHTLARAAPAEAPLRIGHPSGTIMVAAALTQTAEGFNASSASVFRTARRLFQGEVLYDGSLAARHSPYRKAAPAMTQPTHAATQASLVEAQFSPNARAYVASATHAKGEDLQHFAALLAERKPSRVLDIGCGGGHLSYTAAPLAGEVVACDLSAGMLDAVREEAHRRHITNIRTEIGVAESLDIPDASFDVVATRMSAHHWGDLAAGLREARRVIKPGGMAVFIDIVSPGTPALDTFLQAFEILRDPSHVRDYSVSEWQHAVAHAGFATTSLREMRLKIAFADWIARMRTPALLADAIRTLQSRVAKPVRDHFAIQDDGSFTFDLMLLAAEPV